MPKPVHEEKNDRLCVRMGKNARMGSPLSLLAHVRVNKYFGGVCVWERTDSPATHHYPAITAQLTTEVFNVVVD